MNTLIDINHDEKSRHKGYNSNISSSEFKDVLFNENIIRHNMKEMNPFTHKIYTQEIDKISLPPFDDERYIKDDGINTLVFGHKDIPKNG